MYMASRTSNIHLKNIQAHIPSLFHRLCAVLSLCFLCCECCGQSFFAYEQEKGQFSASNQATSTKCSFVFFNDDEVWLTINITSFDNRDQSCGKSYLSVINSPSASSNLFPKLIEKICNKPNKPIVSKVKILLLTLTREDNFSSSLQGIYSFTKKDTTSHLYHDKECGQQTLSGQYGTVYPANSMQAIECGWIIQAREGNRLLLKLTELRVGSTEYCSKDNFLNLYEGISDTMSLPDRQYCGFLRMVSAFNKQFITKGNKATLRFLSNGRNNSFRIEWNEIYDHIGKTCLRDGHFCHGGEFCADENRQLCRSIESFCVDRDFVCDNRNSCGLFDFSDELKCDQTKIIAITTVTVLVSLVVAIIVCVIYIRKRQRKQQSEAQEESKSALTSKSDERTRTEPTIEFPSEEAPACRNPQRRLSRKISIHGIVNQFRRTGSFISQPKIAGDESNPLRECQETSAS